MSRSIVCGVDGSDESLAAAGVAARLAEGLQLRLVLAQVVEAPATFPYGDQARKARSWRRIDAEARALFDRLERRFGGIEVEGRVLHGVPAHSLPQLANEEHAALLVLGSRGRGPVKAALFGSVSSSVARAGERPVVIVPPAGRQEYGSAVVCGVDGSDQATDAAGVAAGLAAALRLELVLVHAYEPGSHGAAIPAPGIAPPIDHVAIEARKRREARSLLERVADSVEHRVPASLRVEVGDAAAALERSAEAERAELIVVGSRGRGAIAAALLGSTSARLATSAPKPVVVVPGGAWLQIEGVPHEDWGPRAA